MVAIAIHVSQTGNDTNGDGSQGAPYRTIAHALSVATGHATIQIMGSLYTLSSPVNLNRANTTIIGEIGPSLGLPIDASTKITCVTNNGAFLITTTDVTVENLIIQNCGAALAGVNGGAINFASGSIARVTNVHSYNCSAEQGGAFYLGLNALATIEDVYFSGCVAAVDGGCMKIVDGFADGGGWTIDGATATRGGGIYVRNGGMNVTSIEIRNTAADSFGAIGIDGAHPLGVTADSISIFNSAATGSDTGAFYFARSNILIRNDLTIVDSSANERAGAVRGRYTGATLTVRGTLSVSRCNCSVGGGAILLSQNATIDATTIQITDSFAGGSGGAIWLNNGGHLSANGITIARTFAQQSAGAISVATGALPSSLVANTITVTSATAILHAGALWVGSSPSFMDVGTLTIRDASSGKDGGGVRVMGALNVTDRLIFDNTSAMGLGGALFINSGSLTVANELTITSSYSAGDGGGLAAINTADITIGGTLDIRNAISGDWGAGVSVQSAARLSVGGAVVTQNTLSERGGTIHVQQARMDVGSFADIRRCECSGGGGAAVFLDEALLDINGALDISESVASGTGGAVYVDRSTLRASSASFTDTHSLQGKGAAVALSGTKPVPIFDIPGLITVNNATAPNGEAAIYVGVGNNLTINNINVVGDLPHGFLAADNFATVHINNGYIRSTPNATIRLFEGVQATFINLDCNCTCPLDESGCGLQGCIVGNTCKEHDCTCPCPWKAGEPQCRNGGDWDATCGFCECAGLFAGELCERCSESFSCGTNAIMEPLGQATESCSCVCSGNWEGPPCPGGGCSCTQCPLESTGCPVDTRYVAASCRCVPCDFPYGGTDCADCVVEDVCLAMTLTPTGQFSSDGRSLIIAPVVTSLVQGLTCAQLFGSTTATNLFGTGATCAVVLSSARAVSITDLLISLGDGASVEPGDSITLLLSNGLLPISVLLSSPNAMEGLLLAVIEGNDQYTVCDPVFSFSAVPSIGRLGRPWSIIEWQSPQTDLQQLLDGHQGELLIDIDGGSLSVGAFELQLRLTNFLGFSSSWVSHFFSLITTPTPQALIESNLDANSETFIDDDTVFYAAVTPSTCAANAGTPASIHVSWNLGQGFLQATGSEFVVFAGTLTPGQWSVEMEVIQQFEDEPPLAAITAVRSFFVRQRLPKALIVGGDQWQVAANQTFSLDGSDSFDPGSSNDQFIYHWQCFGCPSNIVFTAGAVQDIGGLAIGMYHFSLQVQVEERFSNIAESEVTVIAAGSPTAQIRLSSGQKLLIGHPFTLLGRCDGGTEAVGYRWSWPANEGLDEVLRTSDTAIDLAFANTGVLMGMQAYQFSLHCMQGESVAEATVHLTFKGSPSGGRCEITPQSGVALLTEFQLHCFDWKAAGGSEVALTYQFSYEIGEVSYLLNAVPTIRTDQTIVLSPRDATEGTVTVRGQICDVSGGCTVTENFFTLAPLPLLGFQETQETMNSIQALIDDALRLQRYDRANNLMQVLLQIFNTFSPTDPDALALRRSARAYILQTLTDIESFIRQETIGVLHQYAGLLAALVKLANEVAEEVGEESEAFFKRLTGSFAADEELPNGLAEFLVQTANSLLLQDQVESLFDSTLQAAQLNTNGLACGEKRPLLLGSAGMENAVSLSAERAAAEDLSSRIQGIPYRRFSSDEVAKLSLYTPAGTFGAEACFDVAALVFSVSPFGDSTPTYVVEYTLVGQTVTDLLEDIVVEVPLVETLSSDDRKDLRCKYYDIEREGWSSSGCRTLNVSTTSVFCACNHLSSFAALISTSDDVDGIYIASAASGGAMVLVVILFVLLIYYIQPISDCFYGREGARIVASRDVAKRLSYTDTADPTPRRSPRPERVQKAIANDFYDGDDPIISRDDL